MSLFRQRKVKRKGKADIRQRYEQRKASKSDPPPQIEAEVDFDLDYDEVTDVIQLALTDLEEQQAVCHEQTLETIKKLESLDPEFEKDK